MSYNTTDQDKAPTARQAVYSCGGPTLDRQVMKETQKPNLAQFNITKVPISPPLACMTRLLFSKNKVKQKKYFLQYF